METENMMENNEVMETEQLSADNTVAAKIKVESTEGALPKLVLITIAIVGVGYTVGHALTEACSWSWSQLRKAREQLSADRDIRKNRKIVSDRTNDKE